MIRGIGWKNRAVFFFFSPPLYKQGVEKEGSGRNCLQIGYEGQDWLAT